MPEMPEAPDDNVLRRLNELGEKLDRLADQIHLFLQEWCEDIPDDIDLGDDVPGPYSEDNPNNAFNTDYNQ